jgi:hypothetical protein
VISGRFRPEVSFERVSSPGDLGAVLEILDLGRSRIPVTDLPAGGPGVSYVLAPFRTPRPSRFSDGGFGVLYAASTAGAARAEHGYHLARFLAATAEPAQPLTAHELTLTVEGGAFADVGALAGKRPELLHPDPASYPAPQQLGAELRAAGADGVVYPSVRASGAHCVGAFRQRCVRRCELVGRLAVEWTGAALGGWWDVRPLPGGSPA